MKRIGTWKAQQIKREPCETNPFIWHYKENQNGDLQLKKYIFISSRDAFDLGSESIFCIKQLWTQNKIPRKDILGFLRLTQFDKKKKKKSKNSLYTV